MSGSVETMRWNACVHRLDLGLNSYPKEFWENGIRTHINSKGPSTGGSEEGQSWIYRIIDRKLRVKKPRKQRERNRDAIFMEFDIRSHT